MEESFNFYAKLLESMVSLKLDSVMCQFFSGVIPTMVDWLVWYISCPSYLEVVCKSISKLWLLSSVENCRSITCISYTCMGHTAERSLQNTELLVLAIFITYYFNRWYPFWYGLYSSRVYATYFPVFWTPWDNGSSVISHFFSERLCFSGQYRKHEIKSLCIAYRLFGNKRQLWFCQYPN